MRELPSPSVFSLAKSYLCCQSRMSDRPRTLPPHPKGLPGHLSESISFLQSRKYSMFAPLLSMAHSRGERSTLHG